MARVIEACRQNTVNACLKQKLLFVFLNYYNLVVGNRIQRYRAHSFGLVLLWHQRTMICGDLCKKDNFLFILLLNT